MISEITKRLYGLDLKDSDTLEEAASVEPAERNLTKDIVIEAAKEILGTNNNADAFIVRSTAEKKLVKVQVMNRLKTILKKYITNETTGEISHKNENAKRCIKRVAELLLEALFRVKTKDTDQLKKEVTKYYSQKVFYAFTFKRYNYDEYRKLPQMINQLEKTISVIKEKFAQEQKALKAAERAQRIVDKEIESRERIKNEFDVWSNANLTEKNISPVLVWLYHSIENIKGVYPPSGLEMFMETWAPELEEAGIDPDKVEETSEGRWGFSLVVNLNGKALRQLEREAQKNETAKIVLDALTSVTTLKRIGMETWAVREVLKNGKLTGNYWVIALIRKLNELSEIDGGYPFDIGDNRNKDLNFTFIDDEEEDGYPIIHAKLLSKEIKESIDDGHFWAIVYKQIGDDVEQNEIYDDFDDARADFKYMVQENPKDYEYAVLQEVTIEDGFEDITIIGELRDGELVES